MEPEKNSPLRAATTAPDSVTLEIFLVRVPANDRQFQQQLWNAVDEQSLDVEVRHQLVRNGFRAGLLCGALPTRLASSLHLESEAPQEGFNSERKITELSADPKVVRRVVQVNRHEPATIQTTSLLSEVDILLPSDQGLSGRSYKQVQPTYLLRAQAMDGQRIRLQLTPELQHGQLRNRYSPGDQGIFLMTPSRECETFDQLQMTADLSAGDVFVAGCLLDTPASLGSAFHNYDSSGPRELKLVLVRMLEVPPSELLVEEVGIHFGPSQE